MKKHHAGNVYREVTQVMSSKNSHYYLRQNTRLYFSPTVPLLAENNYSLPSKKLKKAEKEMEN